ncbi:MAG: TIGR00730 family Rossman fold protein [Planctomycetota bacterium]|nr:TIGR00730 family Rossman fold protein [Planctomycetota bacterium]
MGISICVFCASSNDASPRYLEVARKLGRLMVERDHTLIYGGGSVGLMGELAREVQQGGGRVVGVIPERLSTEEIAFEAAEELLVTADMAERKNIMIERAEAFICLPGAFGTLDEMLEIITLKQLDYHDKPIVLVNTDGFYDTLLGFFRRLEEERLIYKECLELYEAVSDVESALELLEAEPGSTPGADLGGN